MKRLVCSPSLTFLQPPSFAEASEGRPADERRRLGSDSIRLLKLLSIFSREHPVDLCARLLREEARRVLRLPPLATDKPRAKRGPGRPGLWMASRGPPG